MNLLILLFIISLIFGIYVEEKNVNDFQPFVKGSIIFLGALILSFFVYFKLKKLNNSQILFTLIGLFFRYFHRLSFEFTFINSVIEA